MNRTPLRLGIAAAAALSLAACSSSGGKQTTDTGTGDGAAAAKTMTIIMVTHQAPGDTFWDRIRKGAEAAAVTALAREGDWADLERDTQSKLGATDDYIEGVMAFLEKRPASFNRSG